MNNVTNNNLLLIFNFIKELKLEFNKQIKLKADIFIHINNYNELIIDFYTEYKGKNYVINCGFNEFEFNNNDNGNDNDNGNIDKINITIKSAQKLIFDKIING